MRDLIFLLVFLIHSFSYSQRIKTIDKQTGKIIRNVTVYNEGLTINLSSNNEGFVDVS